MGENWLDTDYETEGVRALEMTVEQLRLVPQDPYRWKWAIIALHNALQAFLVHAVSGSALIEAMTEKFQRRWHEAYERGEILREGERIAPVNELMKRARRLKRYTYKRSSSVG